MGRSRDRPRRGEVSSEVMSLETSEIAYLLGRNGSTKQRLANFSGARLEIDPREDGGRIEVIGTQEERELARLCVDITLQQRNNGKVQVDIEKLESRTDCSFLDVPKDAVGFILVRGLLESAANPDCLTLPLITLCIRREPRVRLCVVSKRSTTPSCSLTRRASETGSAAFTSLAPTTA
jgi:hypothetical protein